MSNTPKFSIPELPASSSQPEVYVDTASRILEIMAQAVIKDRTLTTPPGTQVDGDMFWINGTGAGDWTGHSNVLALYVSTSLGPWFFITPQTGWRAYLLAESRAATYNGTAFTTVAGFMYVYKNDFDRTDLATVADPVIAETVSGAGAASSRLAGAISGALGVIDLSTGTTNTGRTFVSSRAADLTSFGDGVTIFRARVRLPVLSDGTETYSIRVAFDDSATNTAPTDGAWFSYTHATNSGKWVCNTASNSTTTATNAATAAPVANTWTALEVRSNAAGTSIAFYVDGVLVATNTTNIPVTFGTRDFGFGFGIVKSAGTTARKLQADFMEVEKDFTTARAA